ncbi:acyl carrier protein phosphodiesterase [Candidatus Albibeggiatoa sp. nov. NOAA]|uniref:acyl carrier protein phosphodiesterase n=1 Tax=Candidatus Albibeggiatoa sp. nov. NOAA TaxID=3162724 RepID=UPI0032FBB531|nr:acyl carrier protein phosphodiesterase [Thiotrichaceae bacterium]
MNWLAHIFVSEPDIHYQLGNILADPMKGRVWTGIHPQTLAGFARHQKIDKFTDYHYCFIESKNRLGQRGLLRGVVIDIVYDYLLTKHWQVYTDAPFEQFIANFYQQALTTVKNYPSQAEIFINDIIEADILRSYHNLDGVKLALQRIDRRLSTRLLKKESASQYFPEIQLQITAIEKDFQQFFPELLGYFEGENT